MKKSHNKMAPVPVLKKTQQIETVIGASVVVKYHQQEQSPVMTVTSL